MATDNQAKLDRYLRSTLLEQHLEGPCVKLLLKHVISGKGTNPEPVQTYPIGSAQTFDEELVEGMSRRIYTDAEMDAENGDGVQRYQLIAYHANEPNQPLSRCTLRFRGNQDAEDGSGFDSEPATKDGIIAQQMRHNEALVRANVTSVNNAMEIITAQNRQLAAQNEAFMSDRARMMEVQEKMMSEAHGRFLAEKQAENDMMMKQQLGQKLMMLAPVVVNKLAGAKVLPEAMNPQTMALQQLAQSLMSNPEQMEKIVSSGIFSPEQLAVIATLIESAAPQEQPNGKVS